MSNETRPRMLQTSWHKVKLAMEKTGIEDRNEAIQAVADGYINATSEIEDEREVHKEIYAEAMIKRDVEVLRLKMEKQSLTICLAVSASSNFILLSFIAGVKGWW